MQPKISIVIPCYNQDAFLDKCIASIHSQSFENWECLLVDDGSTDKTAEISKFWEAKDQRFRYFYKENGGVSTARNLGIEKSLGEFIFFVDSDDFLYDHFALQHFADKITEDVDLISANFCFIHENEKISYPKESEIIQQQETLIKEEILNAYLDQKISGIGCNKIIRRELLIMNNFHFKENMPYSEDVLLLLQIFTKADKMICISFCTYCYNRTNLESATTLSIGLFADKWRKNQLIMMQEIAQMSETPRWQLINKRKLIHYFVHQYNFLKEEDVIAQKKHWKEMYRNVQKIYHSSILNQWQKRFVYNANISYFAYSRMIKLKNKKSFAFRLLSRFITF